MNDYITKPVNPASLSQILEKWLPHQAVITGGKGSAAKPPLKTKKSALPPVWDSNGLMARLMGDRNLAEKVLKIFLEQTPNQIHDIKNALETGDFSRVELLSHSIKGACANIGANRLQAVACDIEIKARSGDAACITSRIQDLKTEFDMLKKVIQKNFSL